MLGKDPVEHGRRVVEGEAQVPDQALLLFFGQEIPYAILIVDPVRSLSERMEQVKVKVVHAQPPTAGVELRQRLFPVFRRADVELGGNGKALPGMTLYQRFARGLLRAIVNKSGVKVGAAAFEEPVGQRRGQVHIDGAVRFARQTHQAKAEFELVFHFMCHVDPSRKSRSIRFVQRILYCFRREKSIARAVYNPPAL